MADAFHRMAKPAAQSVAQYLPPFAHTGRPPSAGRLVSLFCEQLHGIFLSAHFSERISGSRRVAISPRGLRQLSNSDPIPALAVDSNRDRQSLDSTRWQRERIQRLDHADGAGGRRARHAALFRAARSHPSADRDAERNGDTYQST